MVANEGIIITLKDVLTHILNCENRALRIKGLEFAMEWLSDIAMDFTKAEKGLKAEISNNPSEADKWIEKILDDLDSVEYEEK